MYKHNSNLLIEAVADAKAVKELAMKAAEQSMIEELRPDLKALLAETVNRSIDGDEENDEEITLESLENTSGIIEENDELELDVVTESDDKTDDDDDDTVDENTILEMDYDDELDLEIVDDEMDMEYDDYDNNESLHTESLDEEYTIDELIESLDESDTIDESIDEEYTIDELIESLSTEMNDTIVEFDDSEYIERIQELESNLEESQNAVMEMKSQLQEINMLNAKLLFSNKIFRKFNLDGKSKLKIIENFDRSTTIREAKLIFQTLSENLTSKRKNTKSVESLTEAINGGASRPLGSTAPPKEIVENADWQVRRIQQIAGIATK